MSTVSFLQMAGALPFSSFLKGGKNRTIRNKTRRTTRRNNTHRRTTRRKTTRQQTRRNNTRRRTTRQQTHRNNTRRRTTRQQTRRNNTRRNNTRRKTQRRTQRRTSRKVLRCECDSKKISGKEPSPKGLGKCAHCIPLNVVLKGKDGNMWENKKYSKGKRWVRIY